jgi:hypothetical protein
LSARAVRKAGDRRYDQDVSGLKPSRYPRGHLFDDDVLKQRAVVVEEEQVDAHE